MANDIVHRFFCGFYLLLILLHSVFVLCIMKLLSGVLMMGRRNPKNCVCDGQKIISNPVCGWRAVNILNKPAIPFYSFEPPTIKCLMVFCLNQKKGWG